MSYANQALRGKDGSAVNVQAEFTQQAVVVRDLSSGEVVVAVTCAGGKAVVDVPAQAPAETTRAMGTPSGDEPKDLPHGKPAAHNDK